jgi:hypothetical protein
MNAIKRHALGLGIVLFAAATFLAVAPVSSGGLDCGSPIWRSNPNLGTVDVVGADGSTTFLPDPARVAAKNECVDQRQLHATLSVSLAVAGLVGVFWSVVASPAAARRRAAHHRLA